MLTHHAYLCKLPVVSEKEAAFAATQLACQEVVFFTTESFGIDDVRELTLRAYTRPAVESQQLLVVTFTTITVEAQQALLKLLEEPPVGTVFLFCVPESVYLLPTVLSRFSELRVTVSAGGTGEVFTSFLAQSAPERITDISERLNRKENDWVSAIKVGLIEYLTANSKRYAGADLNTLLFAAEHLLTRGAANKYLLEEIAFTLDKAAEKP